MAALKDSIEIKSKLHHIFECEVERLGQSEASDILGIQQPNISRTINNPDTATIAWYVRSLGKLGYKCIFIVEGGIT